MMLQPVLLCIAEVKKKKKRKRKTGGFRKKLDSRICDFRKRRTQTQIKNRNNICKRKNT